MESLREIEPMAHWQRRRCATRRSSRTIGVWNDELDRIARFHTEFGTAVEEMETASAAQTAGLWNVPFLGVRVVSDNITNGGAYDPKTGEACEDYVYQVLKAYVATLKR